MKAGKWIEAKELVSLIYEFVRSALQEVFGVEQCSNVQARTLHNACLVTCMFGYIPPVRLACVRHLRTLQPPQTTGCHTPDCQTQGCKGNRLEVKPRDNSLHIILSHYNMHNVVNKYAPPPPPPPRAKNPKAYWRPEKFTKACSQYNRHGYMTYTQSKSYDNSLDSHACLQSLHQCKVFSLWTRACRWQAAVMDIKLPQELAHLFMVFLAKWHALTCGQQPYMLTRKDRQPRATTAHLSNYWGVFLGDLGLLSSNQPPLVIESNASHNYNAMKSLHDFICQVDALHVFTCSSFVWQQKQGDIDAGWGIYLWMRGVVTELVALKTHIQPWWWATPRKNGPSHMTWSTGDGNHRRGLMPWTYGVLPYCRENLLILQPSLYSLIMLEMMSL